VKRNLVCNDRRYILLFAETKIEEVKHSGTSVIAAGISREHPPGPSARALSSFRIRCRHPSPPQINIPVSLHRSIDTCNVIMADTELGFAIAFYLYPCGLFVTLFSSQLVRYRYRDAEEPSAAINEKKAEKTHRLYTKLIWIFQLLLFPLLVCIA